MRELSGDQRVQARRAMREGDQQLLPAQHRGEARALVRDIVDSRRNAGGLFLIVAVVVLAGYFTPDTRVRSFTVSLWTVVFLLILVDSVMIGRRVRKMVNQRLPDHKERTSSLVWYGVSRATMIRRWRMPKPRVGIGDRI